MEYNNYQRAFVLSCILHIFILAGAAIIFAAFPSPREVQQIEIEMVSSNEYRENHKNSPAVSLPGMNSFSPMENKTADDRSTLSGNIPNLPQDIKTALAASDVIRPTSTVLASGSDAATQAAIATETSSLGHLAGTGERVNSGGSGVGPSPSTSGSSTLGTGLSGENFSSNGDGTYTALSSTGIDYTILNSVEAQYPEEARAVSYTRNIRVETVILVGLDGNVESVSILNNVPNLGFREAARQALLQWKFSPIYYQGINIKMKFYKNIYFEPS